MRKLALLAAVLLAVPTGGAAIISDQPSDEALTFQSVQRAQRLLDEMRWEANRLAQYAAELQAFADRDWVSWESHAASLDFLRARLNRVGEIYRELNGMRSSMLGEQRATLDRIAPSLVVLSNQTKRAVARAGDLQWKPALLAPEYRTAVDVVYERAKMIERALGGRYESPFWMTASSRGRTAQSD